MPVNIGNQIITLKFYDEVTTENVNRRFKDLRPLGVYHGGYLTRIDDTHISVSPAVCEIWDGDSQVRGETQDTVPSIVVGLATPYVVLRWQYTGDSAQDYMAVLGVSTPASTDLVLGKGSYAGSVMTGISYADRTNPGVLEMFLRAEPLDVPEMRVYVRAGRYKTPTGVVNIPHTTVGAFAAPLTQDKVYLIYVDHDTGSLAIDNSGVESLTPIAPAYAGRVVLAEITLTPSTTQITEDEIRDVRTFMERTVEPDDVTIEVNGDGKLATLNPPAAWPGFGVLTDLDSLGSPLVRDEVYQANGDGYVMAFQTVSTLWGSVQIEAGLAVSPLSVVAVQERNSHGHGRVGAMYPVSAGEFVSVKMFNLYGSVAATVNWKPVGTSKLVKQ